MKIQCEQCKIEYNIDDAAIGERGIRAQCPRCNFITTIRKSQAAILDQARAKLDMVICVNCGKQMEAVPGDPIPICASCQAQSIDVGQKTNVAAPASPSRTAMTPSRTPAPMGMPPQSGGMATSGGIQVPDLGVGPGALPPVPSSFENSTDGLGAGPGEVIQWKIKKSPTGEVYGPFDRDLIQGWIEGEKIVPADEISRVGGPWRPAGEHEDFAAIFAARYNAAAGNGGGPAGATIAPAPSVDVRKTVGGQVTGGRIVSPKVQAANPLPWKAILAVSASFAVVGVLGVAAYSGALASFSAKFRSDPPPPPPDLTDKMIDQLRAQYPSASGSAGDHIAAGRAAAEPDTVEAWTAARAEFAQALAIDRKNVEALALAGEMNALLAGYDQQTNLLDEALRFTTRATEWDKASVPAARARAAALLASGPSNAAEARTILETVVIPAAPEDAVALAMLGRATAPADSAKAEEIFKKAMEKGPTLLRPRVDLGLLYEGTHRYQHALETFKPILDRSFLAAYRTGKIRENVGAYAEAAQAYKIAAQVAEPNGGRPWADAVISHAVILYQALGKTKEAASALAPLEQKFLAAGATETLRADQLNRLRLHLAILSRLNGDFAKSIELSRQVLATRELEFSAAANFNIGLAAMRKGDFNEADKALDEADSPGLDDRAQSEIYYWHGVVKMRRGEIQPAESAFEDAKKEDGQNWRAIVAHASLIGKSGERDVEAMAKMQDLASIDPTIYEQYQRVTLFYPDPPSELLALAQKTFDRIDKATNSIDARSSTALGVVSFFTPGKRAQSQAYFRKALAEIPPDPTARLFMALLLEQKGKAGYTEALAQLNEAKSQVPSAYLSTLIGRIEVQRGNYDKAMSDLQDALNRDPNYTSAHYWLGIAYQKKGDSRQAMEKWTAALKHDPDFVRASRAMFDVDRPAT